MDEPRLTPEEDAELRRLYGLHSFGMVSGAMRARYEVLRNRDRRDEVREPEESTIAVHMEEWPIPKPRAPYDAAPLESVDGAS